MAPLYHGFGGNASAFMRYDTGKRDLVTGNLVPHKQTKKNGPEGPFLLGFTLQNQDEPDEPHIPRGSDQPKL
jgi:hypothetical protein